MIIGLDIDGVTADFVARVNDAYRQWSGDEPTDGDGSYHLASRYPTLPNNKAVWEMIENTHGFWETVSVIPGTVGAVHRLLEHEHRIKILTARKDTARAATVDWVRSWWPSTTMPEISTGLEPAEKWKIPCQVYVDDAPHVIDSLRANGQRVITFDQPWNQEVPQARIRNLWQLPDVLELI